MTALEKNSSATIQTVQQQFSGPIPPPTILEKYNTFVPGSAERIIKMAEEQALHRREIEKCVIASDVRNSLLGIVSAFLIAVGVLILAYRAILSNQPTVGIIITALGLSSVVGTFIYGTNSRKKERETKSK